MASSATSRPHLKRRADDDLPGPSVKRPRSQSPPLSSNRPPPPSGHGPGTPTKVLRRSLDGSPVPGSSHEFQGPQDADDDPVMPVDYFTQIYPSTENPYAPTGYGIFASAYPQFPLAGPSNVYLNAAVASFEACLMGGYYGPVPGALAPPPLPGYPAPYPVYYPPYSVYGPPAPPPPAAPAAAQPYAPAPQLHVPAAQPYAPAPQPHEPAHPHAPQLPQPVQGAVQDQVPSSLSYDDFRNAFAATPTPTERMDAEALREAYPGEYPEIPRIYPIRVSSPPVRVPELVPDVVREARVGGGAGRVAGGAGRVAGGAGRAAEGAGRVAGDERSIHGDGPSRSSSPDPFTPLTPAEVIQHTLRAREEAPPWYECISRWRETVRGGRGEDPSARLMPKTPARDLRATRVHDSHQTQQPYPHMPHLPTTRLPTPQPTYTGPFNPPYDVDEAVCRLPAARVPFSKDPRLGDWRRPVGLGVGVGEGARVSQPVSVEPGEGSGGPQVEARADQPVEARADQPVEARADHPGAPRPIDEMVDAFVAQLDRVVDGLIRRHAAQLVETRAEDLVEARADEVVEAHPEEPVEARADGPGEAATGEPLVPRSYAQQLERQVAILQANAAEQEEESAKEVARLEANVAELEANMAELADDRAQLRGVLATAEDDVADLGEELLFSRRLAAGARAALAGCRYQFEKMRMRLEDVKRERDELKVVWDEWQWASHPSFRGKKFDGSAT
ncbi:hypothetical protein EV714DRAFT_277369, partial [Schizophyllum commune]